MLYGYRYDRYVWLQHAANRAGDGGYSFRLANAHGARGFAILRAQAQCVAAA
jgi:hypothetical protein